MKEATLKYLLKECVLTMDAKEDKVKECLRVIKALHKEYLPRIKDKKNAPLIGLLDGSIIKMFDRTFSKHFSKHISLYGATESAEVKRYDNGYDEYHRLVTERMQDIIRKDLLVYCKNNPDSNRKKVVLQNMVTKLTWLKLRFDQPSCLTGMHATYPDISKSQKANQRLRKSPFLRSLLER
jgi:hypothetical protein